MFNNSQKFENKRLEEIYNEFCMVEKKGIKIKDELMDDLLKLKTTKPLEKLIKLEEVFDLINEKEMFLKLKELE